MKVLNNVGFDSLNHPHHFKFKNKEAVSAFFFRQIFKIFLWRYTHVNVEICKIYEGRGRIYWKRKIIWYSYLDALSSVPDFKNIAWYQFYSHKTYRFIILEKSLNETLLLKYHILYFQIKFNKYINSVMTESYDMVWLLIMSFANTNVLKTNYFPHVSS